MGNEAWPAHWFTKKNIHRPSVEDCIEELKILQTGVRRGANQAGYEYGAVVNFIRRYLPEYDALCHLPETTNHLPQYADHLLRQKIQVISVLIERLMMVELQPRIYQVLPYDNLKIAAPAQAFHLLLLEIIQDSILSILHDRHSSPKE